MRVRKGQRGFTLVELAIVLVIIGIIMGLVLKGQDLINNARMKKLTNTVRKWEVGLWTCYDRTGRFPGDTDKNGIIDTDPLSSSCSDASCTCFQNLAQGVTSHEVRLGSYTFYIYPGSDNSTPARNVLAVCGSSNCQTVTNGDNTYADFLRSFDTSIDGEANATAGVVRALDSASVSSGVATSVSAATSGDWTSSTLGAVYYFDRKPE